MPVLVLEGSYGEMGRKYGHIARQQIRQNVDLYLNRFTTYGHLTESDVLSLGAGYCHRTREYNPAIADMLDGVAAGSGVDSALIYALNARTEILYAHAHLTDACTALSVLPTHTASGHLLIGQNWDWHPEQRDMALVLATRDPAGLTVVTLTEAGMLAKSGFNSAGLGVMANLLMSDRDRGGDGVPYHILLRGVLQSSSMAYALRAATDYPRVCSGNFLIGDREGECIDLEVVPGDFGYLLPDDHGVLVHANHFLSSVPVVDKRKSHSALSLIRPSRAGHLLADALQTRSVSPDDFKRVFRDHYSHPNGICRHIDVQDPPEEQNCSVSSVVIDLNDQWMDISGGNPCETPYARMSMASLYPKKNKR